MEGGYGVRTTMLGWIDGVKMALGSRGMTAKAMKQCVKD